MLVHVNHVEVCAHMSVCVHGIVCVCAWGCVCVCKCACVWVCVSVSVRDACAVVSRLCVLFQRAEQYFLSLFLVCFFNLPVSRSVHFLPQLKYFG